MTEKSQNTIDSQQIRQAPLAHGVTEIVSNDTVGALMLGIVALVLLAALLRAQARNRALVAHISQQSE